MSSYSDCHTRLSAAESPVASVETSAGAAFSVSFRRSLSAV